jgi:hypothetical protein
VTLLSPDPGHVENEKGTVKSDTGATQIHQDWSGKPGHGLALGAQSPAGKGTGRLGGKEVMAGLQVWLDQGAQMLFLSLLLGLGHRGCPSPTRGRPSPSSGLPVPTHGRPRGL